MAVSPYPYADKLYKPLQQDEIRLVEVVADGTDNAHFHCVLRTACLTDVSGQFETLSYVWGDATHRIEISIGDLPFPVTRNLYDFLCEYHRRGQARTRNGLDNEANRLIWIDAICINQDDIDERSEQVAIMNNIYSSSKRTISWLGNSIALSEQELSDFATLAGAIAQLNKDELLRDIGVEGRHIHIGPCFVPGLMDGELASNVLHNDADEIERAMQVVRLS